MKRTFKVIISILIGVLIVFVAFVVWAETPPAPMVEALDYLESDSDVFVIKH